MNPTRVETGTLIRLVVELFASAGLSHTHAQTVADSLVSADLEGVASHGVMLIPMYLARIRAGSVLASRTPTVVEDHGALVVMSAGHGLGQVSAKAAVELGIERAHKFGVAVVTVREAFHFGAASFWARRFAHAGMIGFAFSNTRPLMPAPGGAERVVGNNPMSIAFPSASAEPLVVDMAMSATAMGKIRLAETQGQQIPEGWATDAQGWPTTSPAEAIKGMLLPAAGPKGFGLAVAIDLLCGALSGGSVGAAVRPLYTELDKFYDCAHTFIAIDAARVSGGTGIGNTVDAFAHTIRTSKKAAGTERIFAPGELERARRTDAALGCPLPIQVIDEINALAQQANLESRLTLLNSEHYKEYRMKTQITSPRLAKPNGHFSQATAIESKGRLVFISGMTARTQDGTIAGIGNIEEQTRQVCKNLAAAAEAAGGTLEDICRVDVYVRNIEHFSIIHKVRQEFFKPPLPASTMVEVAKMVSPEYLIEISAIAVLPDYHEA